MPEFEPKPRPSVEIPTLDDVESYRRMQAISWLDTYPSETAGVSYEWVKNRTDNWLTPDEIKKSKERVKKILEDTAHQFLYVAKVGGQCVGMVNTTSIDGNQRLEALYVDKDYHGTGLGQRLTDQALSHLDLKRPVVLEVISYNKKAQYFYERNGFEIIPDSEHFYADIMPSLKMVRPGDK